MTFRLLDYIKRCDSRTVKAKINIIYMLFLKGASILISLILIPLTLHYVDSETYGVWLTLSSMIAWVSFFDIGINNGLKNKLTETLAKDDFILGRTYVSTTYALLFLIFIPLMIFLLFLTPLINWGKLLNIHTISTSDLNVSITLIIIYFCIHFIFNTINIILLADQRPADASLRSLIQQIVSIVVIFLLTKTTEGNLVKLCLGLCISPIITVLIFNITLFKGRYKHLRPSVKYVDFNKLPDLLKLGVQFFIIQIAGVVQFQMVNFLIIRNYGAADVTSYNIAHKYFNVLYMVWSIMTTPVWAAVTDAMTKGDFVWIKKMCSKYMEILFIFFACGIFMLIFSQSIYGLWVGKDINIGWGISICLFLYNIVIMFGSVFVAILNGTGNLKTQVIACTISPIIFLVVTKIMINLGVGVYSIIIGSIIANYNGFIIAPIQCYKFLKNKV